MELLLKLKQFSFNRKLDFLHLKHHFGASVERCAALFSDLLRAASPINK